MAALVLVSGGPASGKTATAQAVAAALRDAGMPVVVVSEEGDPATLYADPPSEKQTRGALRSRVDRALSSSKPPPAVVVDGCNAVKGFRYELWCLGRPSGARFCCVFCPQPGSSSSTEADDDGGDDKMVGRWPRALFEDLAARVEPPDPRNRWEQPLFVADARRARTAEGEARSGGGGGGGAPVVRPAPAALPPGGRGAAVEETVGWPLDAVAAAVVAAVAPPRRGAMAKKKAADGSGALDAAAASINEASASSNSSAAAAAASAAPLPETLPLATTSVALRPAKCTLAARVASADALGDLDAAAQGVLLAVAAALSRSSSSAAAAAASATGVANGAAAAAAASPSESAFAAIEIPLPAKDEDGGDDKEGNEPRKQKRRGDQEEPLTLSLRRAPSLAELRRHKRDFLRAATAPMAGPLPSGARARASAFCEYLKRRVV